MNFFKKFYFSKEKKRCFDSLWVDVTTASVVKFVVTAVDVEGGVGSSEADWLVLDKVSLPFVGGVLDVLSPAIFLAYKINVYENVFRCGLKFLAKKLMLQFKGEKYKS